MYYIVCLNEGEFLFDYDLSTNQIEVTSMDIEARQFESKVKANYVAERIGGKVKEIN